METERLRQVLADLSHSLVQLQGQIEKANQLLASTTALVVTPPPSLEHGPGGGSPPALQPRIEYLERRVEELEASERELTTHLEDLLQRHRMCETEIGSAVLAREGIMRRYRHLVRVAVDLLQSLTQVFPLGEEIDEETRSAVEEDLRERLYSSDTETSSSSSTAHPPATGAHTGVRGANRKNDGTIQSMGVPDEPQTDPSNMAETNRTSATESPGIGQEVTLPIWAVHSGSRCPGCVKAMAGPFVEADFLRLGFDSGQLDDVFQSLILPRDVLCRLAAPPSPGALGNTKFVFLYDPLYLESGTRTYILDWGTARANREVIRWVQNNAKGDGTAVFHTFTFPTKKKRWYYLGGLSWNVVSFNDIWPTLNDQSRISISRQLSERSHGTVKPEEVARQLGDGRLQQLCIEIASANETETVQEVASRMGRSPRAVKTKRRIVPAEQ